MYRIRPESEVIGQVRLDLNKVYHQFLSCLAPGFLRRHPVGKGQQGGAAMGLKEKPLKSEVSIL